MIKRNLARLAIGLAVAVTLGASAQAAHKPSNGPLDRQFMRGQPQPPAGTTHKLKSTYENWSTTGVTAAAATYVPVDAVTVVKCPGGGPCTIVAETSSQVLGVATSGRWAICTYVDGNTMNGSCLWQGQVANDYAIGGNRANYTVSGGNHQVQSFVYMEQGGEVTTYQYDYEVYLP